MLRITACFLAMLCGQFAVAVDTQLKDGDDRALQPPADAASHALVTLQSKLHGTWDGNGACDGSLVVAADGTFRRQHYSPGNNAFTGTWKVRWDALPPTLVFVCETSDDPDRVGKTSEVKLLQLNDKSLSYQFPIGSPTTYTRSTVASARDLSGESSK